MASVGRLLHVLDVVHLYQCPITLKIRSLRLNYLIMPALIHCNATVTHATFSACTVHVPHCTSGIQIMPFLPIDEI